MTDKDLYASGGMMELVASSHEPHHVELVALARRVAGHQLYSSIESLDDVRFFMGYHVWCVWDFMCLVKSVQLGLGHFSLPWRPSKHPHLLHLINQIIESEETDVGPHGRPQSHFETFVEAMNEAGAETSTIKFFLKRLEAGERVPDAMRASGADECSIEFVGRTLADAAAPVHVRAATLCLAREELVPRMLSTLVNRLPQRHPELRLFEGYVSRHIELDFGEHGSTSAKVFRGLVDDNSNLMREGIAAAIGAITSRLRYLDAILDRLASYKEQNGQSYTVRRARRYSMKRGDDG